MNSIDPISGALKDALELKPMRGELDARVARIGLVPVRRTLWLAWGSAVAAAAGLVAVAVLLSAPRLALADEILQAARHVHGHIMVYTIGPGGSRTLNHESWVEGGLSFSLIGPRGQNQQQFVDTDKDRAVLFWPKGPALTFLDHGIRNHYDEAQALSEGDLETMAKRFQANRSGPLKTGRTTFEGHPADYVELDLKTNLQRIQQTFYADPIDHHILGFHDDVWNDPKLVAMGQGKRPMFRLAGLNVPHWETIGVVASSAFPSRKPEPVFRIEGRDVNVYQERDALHDRLSKSVGSCELAGNTVRVRDLSRNPSGDLFVLYTAGAEPPDLGFSVEDGLGGTYMVNSDSGRGTNANRASKELQVDGEPLQSAWFAHGSGPLSRGPIRLKFWLEGTGRVQTSEVSLTPTIAKGDLPDYSLYIGGGELESFQRERLELVAEALVRSQQYGAAVPVLRKAIAALVESGSESAWLREELGHCLTVVKRYPEALVELSRAEKVAEGMNPGQADRIRGEILHLQVQMRKK